MSSFKSLLEDPNPPHPFAFLILSALAIPVLFVNLGDYALVNSDELCYHGMAQSIVESGNWMRLEFVGQHRLYDTFTHAPLFMWLKALVLIAIGDSYWTMRIVSTTAALLAVFATYLLACRFMSRRAALLAGFMQLTTYQFVYLHCGRTGEMEPLIAGLMTILPWLFMRSVEKDRSFILHHVCIIGIINLKLTLAIIPLAAELLCFALVTTYRRHFLRWFLQAAWVLPLGGAWLLYQVVQNWDAFITTASRLFNRAAGEGLTQQHLGPIGNTIYYLHTLFWGGFPYSLLYPIAFAGSLSLRGAHEETRHRWSLLHVYVLTIFAFFALVSVHHAWYIMPVYSFLSIATASWLARLARAPANPWVVAVTAGALAVGAWSRLNWLGFDPFARTARDYNDRVQLVGLGGLGLEICVSLSVTFAVAGGVLVARHLSGRQARGLATAICLGLVLFASVRVLSSHRHMDHITPLETFARELQEKRARGERLDFPIDLPLGNRTHVRYLFGKHYKLRARRIRVDGQMRTQHYLTGEVDKPTKP